MDSFPMNHDQDEVSNSFQSPNELVCSKQGGDIESPYLAGSATSTAPKRSTSITTGSSVHHQRRVRPTMWGASSDILSGGSLHSALHRSSRTQKAYNFDDFGMRSPSTTDRRSILRKRFQRAGLVASGMNSSQHQSFESEEGSDQHHYHHRRRRHRRDPLRANRRKDLYVQSGGESSDEGNDVDDNIVEGESDGASIGVDEDEESDSHDSPAMRAPSRLGAASRRTRKDSDDYNQSHDHRPRKQLGATIGMFAGSLGCGHNAGYQVQELFATLAARQRRTIHITVIAVVVCGLFLCYELHNHLVRQESMILSYVSGKDAVMQRLQLMQYTNFPIANVDPGTPIVPMASTQKALSKKGFDDRIASLSTRVESLQTTLQQMARQQLADNFPLAFTNDKERGTSSRFVDVKLDLNGQDSSLVIQVDGSKMPYTSWTFLRQLRDEKWALQGNHQWFEIVPLPLASDDLDVVGEGTVVGPKMSGSQDVKTTEDGTENAPTVKMSEDIDVEKETTGKGDQNTRRRGSDHQRMDFLEVSAVDVDRRFVLGIRNPTAGEGHGFPIVSIYTERGMCGSFEHEVCFGRVLEGFDFGNLVNRLADETTVTIDNVSVRQSESNSHAYSRES